MSLSIDRLTKRFGATEVLRGIDLRIGGGELVALLGPSGSGKTTLLRIIAGLDWPDAGRLTLGDADWLRLDARERNTGFVFQHYALFPHMTVRDNIAFGLTVRPRATRPARQEIAAKVEELLHFLQIPHLADRFPAALSGGQRQRVALGRALAISPEVLLLDEPFGALDAAVRRDLRRWLREVHEASGTTTIFVTHDQEEAFELADRVVVMAEGRIDQIGTPDEIYDRPATPFVARFLGATVELPVDIRAGRAEAPGLDASHLARVAYPDGPARLFLRAGEVTPVPDPSAPFRVTSILSNGAALRIGLSGPEGAAFEIDVLRRAPEARDMHIGQHIRLRPEAGRIFTEKRPSAPAEVAFPPAEPILKENRL